jgi:alpha-L-fucosidase
MILLLAICALVFISGCDSGLDISNMVDTREDVGLTAQQSQAESGQSVKEGDAESGSAGGKYEASWKSLTKHPIPEWLIDAKFGIYAHWGIYSVPAYGNEWYGKSMYDKDNKRNIYDHHKEAWGGAGKFGYREFIPMFKAENFDPAEWADVIAKSGAKYAGIAVVHHDGFGLWDSEVNRWNAGKMGPKRDLYGDLVKELRKKVDMKVIATFHHIRTFDWFLPTNPEHIKELQDEGVDLFDPEYADFYWNRFTSKQEDFLDVWRAKVKEVTDKYQPDVLWFDGGKFQEEESTEFVTSILAYYLNRGDQWGKEVGVLNKLPTSMQFNFPTEFGVLTYEGGRDRPEIVGQPWIDDLKIGDTSWGYVEGLGYRTVNQIVDGLIDRVSRNGGLLLSLSPKADGTLPEEQKKVLLGIGKWLEINGEAIYGTRPWKIHAEGPVDKFLIGSDHVVWNFEKASAEDIRFTRKGNTLYAIALGWPEKGEDAEANILTIKTLNLGQKIGTGEIKKISLLGTGEPINWVRDDDGLKLYLPDRKGGNIAYTFKIEVNGELVMD